MITVHFSNHIGASTFEHVVEVFDFLLPAAVWARLLVWKKKILPTVEDTIRCGGSPNVVQRRCVMERKARHSGRNSKHAMKAQKQCGSTARLENDLVRKNEHTGLREQVSVHGVRANHRKDLAIHKI